MSSRSLTSRLPSQAEVYLIHFDSPLGAGRYGTAQHYIGWCVDETERMAEHRRGAGARILAACNERGIGWRVVRTWYGGYLLERRLKRHHNPRRLCPVCNPRASWRGLLCHSDMRRRKNDS